MPMQVQELEVEQMIYPSAGAPYGRGANNLEKLTNDVHAPQCVDNIYYPFSSRMDWQLARWLKRSSLTQAEIAEFFKLEFVSFVCSCIYRRIMTKALGQRMCNSAVF